MLEKFPNYVENGGKFPVWVDCFMGRCFYPDIAPALRTRSINDNNDFIIEMKEPKVINPLKGLSDYGWHFEQQVYDAGGIARAVKAGGGSGNIPKVIEPQIAALRGRNPDNPSERGKSKGNYKQRLEMNENGTSNTITSVQKDNLVVEPQTLEHIQPPKYRIRKLTCREAFRLMGVDDKDIDTIQAAGISNSRQYQLAGNSIVVDVLYYLMRNMFIEQDIEKTTNNNGQLTLF